jgi:hypothetical protein
MRGESLSRLPDLPPVSKSQTMSVFDWMIDSDLSVGWQVLLDVVDAPAEVAERARVATAGWGAALRFLAGSLGY